MGKFARRLFEIFVKSRAGEPGRLDSVGHPVFLGRASIYISRSARREKAVRRQDYGKGLENIQKNNNNIYLHTICIFHILCIYYGTNVQVLLFTKDQYV